MLKEIKTQMVPKEELVEDLSHLNCHGCGVGLQCDDIGSLGYVSELKVKQYLQKREELRQLEEDGIQISNVLSGAQLSQKNKQKDLIKHLKSIHAPEAILAEFQRPELTNIGANHQL